MHGIITAIVGLVAGGLVCLGLYIYKRIDRALEDDEEKKDDNDNSHFNNQHFDMH